jgi:MtrB/PioB family decaheme-associated outer membrane protein
MRGLIKNLRGLLWLGAYLAATSVWAADQQPANWQCAKCPFPEGAQLKTTAGAGYQSDDSFKFGDYTGLFDDGAFFVGDVSADYFGANALRWRADGENLGLDSRQIDIQGGWQGRLELRLGYDELPRKLFETSQTVYVNPGSAAQTLPAGWVRAPSTGGMTALGASLRSADADWDRETISAGVSFIQSPRLRYDVDYRHLERDGQRLWGTSFLTAATTLLRPVDDTTDTVDAGISYAANTWTARIAYFGSFYDNDANRFDWENAFTGVPGADNGSTALEPDNEFQQLMITGQYFGWERTRVSGRLAAGQMKQDDRVLPYTVNPLLAGGTLPRTKFDGQVDTLHADVQVSSRPLTRLRLRGEFVYDERQNDTPRDTWDYVITDSITAGDPSENLPYGYERYRLALSGNYRFPMGTRVQLGYQYDNFQRDEAEVNETEDNEVWGQVRLSGPLSSDLRLKYTYAIRDNDNYKAVPTTQPPQNPLLRKYHLADRDRESFEFSLAFQPAERLDLTFTGLFAEDDYDKSPLGLDDGKYRNVTMDAGWRLWEDAALTGQVGYDEFQTTQFGSQTYSTADWSAQQKDESWIAGLSLDLPKLIERLRARIGYTYVDTTGKIDNNTSGLRSSFPNLETTRHRFEVDLRYELRKNIDIGLAYLYEDYDVDDWTLDGVDPDTVANLLASGAYWSDYDVNLVTLSFTWSLER